MIIIHDPLCAEYGSSMRPEQPARVTHSVEYLKSRHADWEWRHPSLAAEETLLLAHTPEHLQRLQQPRDFDADTPFFPGIYEHAGRAAGAAILAADLALDTGAAVSLMRPPGHHATPSEAMGFCYLNSIAIAALQAQNTLSRDGFPPRIAVWDFDAHHGNGTEAILRGREGLFFASVHQSPGYPGTGTHSLGNCSNWPVAPRTPRAQHMAALRESWEAVLQFEPELIMVSAGFDAYAEDPITAMSLQLDDFAMLGQWLGATKIPSAAVLEGGYSQDLPLLIDAFLNAWKK